MNVSKAAFSGFNTVLFGRIASLLAQLLTTAILARIVAVEAFGVIAICLAVVAFGQVISNAGLGPALVQRQHLEQRHIDSAVAVSVLLSFSLFLIVILAAKPLVEFFGIKDSYGVFLFVCITLPLGALSSVPNSLMQRSLMFRQMTIVEIITYVVAYAIPAVILAAEGWGVWALALAMVTQSAARLSLLVYYARRCGMRPTVWSWDSKSIKELADFGVGYTAGAVASYLSLQGDNLIVGREFSQASVGLYSRAYQLIALPANIIGSALDTVLFPLMSRLQDERKALARAYYSGITLMAVLVIPLSISVVFNAEDIVSLLLGPNWIPAVEIIIALSAFMFFRMAYKLTDSVTRALGLVNARAIIKIIYGLLVILASFVGSRYGLVEVAILVGFSVVINYMLMNFLVFRYLPFNFRAFVVAHLRGILLAPLVLVPELLLDNFGATENFQPFVSLSIAGLIYSIVLGVIILWPRVSLGRESLMILYKSIPFELLARRFRRAAGL